MDNNLKREWILKTIDTTKEEVQLLCHHQLLETLYSKWSNIEKIDDEEWKQDIRLLASFYD